MQNLIKSILFLGGIALLGGSSSAQAQFFNYAPGVTPYGYGWGVPYLGAAGGYLEGASSVINASGNLQIQTQEAKAMQEQLKQEKLKTRRQTFDQYRYEQMHTPTPEELKRAQQEEQLRRSRNDPPLTEIWSGKALNDLLKDLQQLPTTDSAYATSMLLDPAILQHINVTNGTTASGSTKLLRDAKIVWPLPLKAKRFDAERKQIDELLPMAVKQARGGSADGDTLENLIGAVKSLKNSLRQQVADIPSTDYIRAKRCVTELEDATRVLQDPNVANYFNKWTARGKDMTELVKNMTQQGLQFAPANNGDQAAYTALHRLMVNYDVATSAQFRGPQVVNRAIYALPKLPSP
jgi:hypothetical protein